MASYSATTQHHHWDIMQDQQFSKPPWTTLSAKTCSTWCTIAPTLAPIVHMKLPADTFIGPA
eukprot:jgi/Pico_ML_1/54401/g4755.t1